MKNIILLLLLFFQLEVQADGGAVAKFHSEIDGVTYSCHFVAKDFKSTNASLFVLTDEGLVDAEKTKLALKEVAEAGSKQLVKLVGQQHHKKWTLKEISKSIVQHKDKYCHYFSLSYASKRGYIKVVVKLNGTVLNIRKDQEKPKLPPFMDEVRKSK